LLKQGKEQPASQCKVISDRGENAPTAQPGADAGTAPSREEEEHPSTTATYTKKPHQTSRNPKLCFPAAGES